jgi:hypothetical protein
MRIEEESSCLSIRIPQSEIRNEGLWHLKHTHHRFVDEAVAGENRRAIDVERQTVVVRDAPARLFNHENSGGDIPGAQALFPESIESAARNVGQIERSRTVAAHGLSAHDEIMEVAREIASVANVVWKACAEHRVIEVVNFRDTYASTV